MFQSRPVFRLSSQNRSAPIGHIMATRSRGVSPTTKVASIVRSNVGADIDIGIPLRKQSANGLRVQMAIVRVNPQGHCQRGGVKL